MKDYFKKYFDYFPFDNFSIPYIIQNSVNEQVLEHIDRDDFNNVDFSNLEFITYSGNPKIIPVFKNKYNRMEK